MPLMLAGALIGLLFLLYMRVEYYKLMNYNPNMGPQIAYYFIPFLLLFIILIALPAEAFCRRYWYTPYTKKEILLIGVGYSTVLTWWVFPGHWYLIFILNPLTVRWILGLIIHRSAQK